MDVYLPLHALCWVGFWRAAGNGAERLRCSENTEAPAGPGQLAQTPDCVCPSPLTAIDNTAGDAERGCISGVASKANVALAEVDKDRLGKQIWLL